MKERARSFRKIMTDAEERMWFFLRNRRLQGYKFVREQAIGCYIADFVCREKKLIVELDGSQHIEKVHYDNERTRVLKGKGYKIIRIWDNDVFIHPDEVREMILNSLR